MEVSNHALPPTIGDGLLTGAATLCIVITPDHTKESFIAFRSELPLVRSRNHLWLRKHLIAISKNLLNCRIKEIFFDAPRDSRQTAQNPPSHCPSRTATAPKRWKSASFHARDRSAATRTQSHYWSALCQTWNSKLRGFPARPGILAQMTAKHGLGLQELESKLSKPERANYLIKHKSRELELDSVS